MFSGKAPDIVGTASTRIPALDVIRGIAISGILVISIQELGGFSSGLQQYYRAGTHGGNHALLSAVSILFEGKMRALFAIVFGAAIVLQMVQFQEKSAEKAVDIYIRRMMWLMAFGIFNAIILLWPGDILFHYAVMGILLFPFWRMPARGLLIAALLCTLVYSAKIYWDYHDDKEQHRKYVAVTAVEERFRKDSLGRAKRDSAWRAAHPDSVQLRLRSDSVAKKTDSVSRLFSPALVQEAKNDTLTKEQKKNKAAWEGRVKSLQYDSAADMDEKKAMRAVSYGKVWNHQLEKSQYRESYWLYRTGIWDIGSMMLLGMALLGFGYFQNRFGPRIYSLLALAGIASGVLLGWYRNIQADIALHDYAKYISTHILPHDWLFPFERAALAFGYLSLVMALRQIWARGRIWNALAATGRMAFTNYFLQTIACTIFFFGYGMGYYGRLSQWQLYAVAAELILMQIVFSVLWLRHFSLGPVEWLWRRLTFRKKISIKKNPAADAAITA